MKMKKILLVGTKIRAAHEILNYSNKHLIPVGTTGTIITAGLDAQFGFYGVSWENDDPRGMMVNIPTNAEVMS